MGALKFRIFRKAHHSGWFSSYLIVCKDVARYENVGFGQVHIWFGSLYEDTIQGLYISRSLL
jgi:hypothetical protein